MVATVITDLTKAKFTNTRCVLACAKRHSTIRLSIIFAALTDTTEGVNSRNITGSDDRIVTVLSVYHFYFWLLHNCTLRGLDTVKISYTQNEHEGSGNVVLGITTLHFREIPCLRPTII
jgi:hypothetical protein